MTATHSPTDEVLIRRTLAGSRVAYGQLVARYQDYVFTICQRVLRQRERAEEAAQDAFIKAYQRLDSFQGESKFGSWLYTIAYRTALDRLRLKQLPTAELDQPERPLQLADAAARADEQLEQADLRTAIERALQQLKPDDATVVTLFYLQEQTVKEIADITGLTETNIKTKLFRSREALRRLLQAQLQLPNVE